MRVNRVAAVGAAAAAALAVGYGVGANSDEPASTTTAAAPGTVTGPCGEIAVPPDSPSCSAIDGLIQYGFWGNFVNAKTTQAWKKANPGEWNRLTAFMATPSKTSTVSMLTPLGAALVALTQAHVYTHGAPFQPAPYDPTVKAGIGQPVIVPPPPSP